MRHIFAALLLGIGLSSHAFQDFGELIHIPPLEGIEGSSLTLEAIYTGDLDQVLNAKVMYRLAGQVGYLELPMEFGDLKFTVDLPGEVIGAPGIEYVIVTNLKSGGLVAFPENSDPLTNPQYVPVEELPADDEALKMGEVFGELIILTPDPGSSFPFGEPLIIAASLFSLENVDIGSVKVFFDNVDVTAYSLITTDLVTYKPDILSAGVHTVYIEVSNIYGVRLANKSWTFTIQSQAQRIFEMSYNGNLNMSHRQDVINTIASEIDSVISGDTVSVPRYQSNTQTVDRVDFSTNLNFDWAKVKLFTNLTSREDSTVQSQNRYGVKVRTSWLRYTYGDETPMMNRLALWGKRVRGHNIDIRFKGLNLHVVSGQTARSITGTASFDSTSSEWRRTGYSFERGLFAIRPSFGKGQLFQFGMFYVHTRDSVNSVKLKPAWNESDFSHELVGMTETINIPFGDPTYTLDDSTRDIYYFLNGRKPEDNIVVGSDVKLALDDHRFVLEGSASFSLHNSNILNGPLTRSQLDTFALLADTTADSTLGTGSFDLDLQALDDAVSGISFLSSNGQIDLGKFSDIFILNENITLPFDLNNLEEKRYIRALTTLGLHFGLKLNYYNNFIHIDYHHLGPGYKALGSPVLRLDGKGWNGWKISDRVRMLNNMLYLNLGFESYRNNTVTLDPVTDPRLIQNTYNVGLTLNPGQGLPTISTTMKYFTRNNNVDTRTEIIQPIVSVDTTTFDTSYIDGRELNESLSSNINLTYILRTGMIRNTFTLSLLTSNMDNLVTGFEARLRSSNLYGLNLRTEWGIPLTTTLVIRNNSNQLYDETNPNFQSNIFNTYRLGSSYQLFSGSLVLRGNVQQMNFESQRFKADVLETTTKKQTNMQLNAQYNISPLTIGETTLRPRVIGGYERRQYVTEYSEYMDSMVSARFEMTF
ncbi:MAG: hypothetical protein K9M49_09040 [Candidatus Marinimicrobia bacterium]|nr:hypothetical protein [Candidatus Neomarinimicrobiota bacterium]MCF7905279.1 hypothetical protein [Candidatus Neomarinimicrobiota bacterium]